MPKSNVIEPVSPYATDTFRADYLSACLRHVAALLVAVPEAAGTLARFAAVAADGPHPYLAAGKVQL